MSHIDRAYRNAVKIKIDDDSKLILMSDCHRGAGGWADAFAVNQNNFFAAMQFYYRNGYTYIELGDGDELWENRRLADITAVHDGTFWLLEKFYRENRLHVLFGNHDIIKSRRPDMLSSYHDAVNKRDVPLFPDIKVHESVLLTHKHTDAELFLLHGHQGDWFNDYCWRLGRFLVRYFWRPLQMFDIKNPTSAAKNQKVKGKVEERLRKWSKTTNKILIAGHTHRPVFPQPGEPKYFNDGSCIHPRCVTGIEITGGAVALIKWGQKTRDDGTLYIGRDVLAGPYRIEDYYKAGAMV